MSEIQFLAEDIKGTYDHRKCGVCGHPLNAHPNTCQRHRYLPLWTRWLDRHPDPRPELLRIFAAKGMTADVETFIDFEFWKQDAVEAGVPRWAIEGDQ